LSREEDSRIGPTVNESRSGLGQATPTCSQYAERMEAPIIQLRYDILSDKTHIADGIGFLCDRLYLGWQGRRQQATEVIRTQQGSLPDVNCRLCARSYADGRARGR